MLVVNEGTLEARLGLSPFSSPSNVDSTSQRLWCVLTASRPPLKEVELSESLPKVDVLSTLGESFGVCRARGLGLHHICEQKSNLSLLTSRQCIGVARTR